MRLLFRFCLVLIMAVALCIAERNASAQDSFAVNKKLGRGINLGNALEAPNEFDASGWPGWPPADAATMRSGPSCTTQTGL